MNTGKFTLMAVGLVIGIAGTAAYLGIAPRPVEPAAKITRIFDADQFKDPVPENQKAFIAALKWPEKTKFRHDMAIVDQNGCSQPPGLENAGLIGPVVPKPCAQPTMGLHVTQRVGFDNAAYYEEAIRYLK